MVRISAEDRIKISLFQSKIDKNDYSTLTIMTMVSVTFTQISEDDPGDCHNNFLKLYDDPDTSSLPFGQ